MEIKMTVETVLLYQLEFFSIPSSVYCLFCLFGLVV